MKSVLQLATELCTAIELAEADIGGARPMNDILGELGPAVDRENAGGWIKTASTMPPDNESQVWAYSSELKTTRLKRAKDVRNLALAAIREEDSVLYDFWQPANIPGEPK